MKKDVIIRINTETSEVMSNSATLGIKSENLQGNLIIIPEPFIDGTGRFFIDEHGSIEMTKQENYYVIPILSSLLANGDFDYCFKITEPQSEQGIPVFVSEISSLKVPDTIESNEEIPEQYPTWIENYDSKIAEINNLEQSIEDAEKDRSIAEQEREDEEQKRISAETTRAENETSRNSAEESRTSAEQTRRTNESNRIVNENGRIEAENNRKNAETSRNSTETQRQSNETARQTAENAREDYITALRQSIENGDFDGATFIPHLDENGNLSWSNNKELDNPPTINIMGPQGPQGETGPKPVAGTDYYTQEEKEDFAAQVIAESKTEIENFTSDKKDEITDLATDKLNELSAVNTLKIISEEVIDL